MSKDIFHTKHGRLFRKGDLCHFSVLREEGWYSAWKEEAGKIVSYHNFKSTDLWILFSVVGDNLENVVILHPFFGKLTVPISSERIVLVSRATLKENDERTTATA